MILEVIRNILLVVGGFTVLCTFVLLLLFAFDKIRDAIQCDPPPSCADCGVCFRARVSDSPEYRVYCAQHADERRRLDERKRVVVSWASENWEKLEKRAIRERKKAERARENAMQSLAGAAAQQQHMQAALQNSDPFGQMSGGYRPLGLR